VSSFLTAHQHISASMHLWHHFLVALRLANLHYINICNNNNNNNNNNNIQTLAADSLNVCQRKRAVTTITTTIVHNKNKNATGV